MPETRDADRAAVYAAEFVAFEGTDLETVVGVDAVVDVVTAVLDGGWWPGPAVVVRSARSDAQSSSARLRGDRPVEIRIAGPQSTYATAAHELGHALAGVERGHGDVFRRAHLDVVQAVSAMLGGDGREVHVAQLADAYAAAGLAIGSRDWPPPPPVGRVFAL